MGISFQNSFEHQADVQSIGCEYLCIGAMCSDLTGRAISTEYVNCVWAQLIADDWADETEGLNTSVSYYHTVSLFFDILGWGDWCGDQVGSIRFGTPRFWSWVKDKRFRYVIRRTENAFGDKHSVLLDRDFNLLYNSAPRFVMGKTTGLYLFDFWKIDDEDHGSQIVSES